MRAKRRCFFDGGHATQQDTYLMESALSRNKTAERLLCGLSGAVSFVLVCAYSDHFQSHRTAGIRSAPLAACEGVRRLSCRLEFLVSDQTRNQIRRHWQGSRHARFDMPGTHACGLPIKW